MKKSIKVIICDNCIKERNEPVNEYGIPIMHSDGIQFPNYGPWYTLTKDNKSWDLCCPECLLDFASKIGE